MDINQKYLTKILRAALKDEKIELTNYKKINLSKILIEARAHKVEGLIFAAINNKNLSGNDKQVIEIVKRETIFLALKQAQHIKNISYLLQKFNDNNIPIIVLKGLVVRYLYPKPDLRTMSDADVLVNIDDLDKARSLLLSLGYRELEDLDEHGAHIVFANYNTVVEVHWRITNKDYYNGNTDFEDYLWEGVMKVKVGDVETLSLGLEDLALHLCVHMAVHLACHGFGIRQLCDLVLLVEKKGNLIDWNIFLIKVKEANIEKFSLALFNICNKLFDMKIPRELQEEKEIEDKYISLFIDDIFNNGVGGRLDDSQVFAKEFAFKLEVDGEQSSAISRKFIKLLFPPIKELNSKYNYAKKYFILAPIAWGHHLFEGVTNKDYSFINKIKIITKTLYVAKNRNKLMSWLEI